MIKQGRILLCAGHNRKAKGARSPELGVYEWQIALPFVDILRTEMESIGFECHTERNSKLTTKVNRTKLNTYDLALDIHFNSFDKIVEGHETLYWYSAKRSNAYAFAITESMLHNKRRPIKSINSLNTKGGYFLLKTKSPAVIVELAFINNYADMLSYYRNINTLARAIASSINETYISIRETYFNETREKGEKEFVHGRIKEYKFI